MARQVIAHLFSSVNGVSESPNEWQFDAFGPGSLRDHPGGQRGRHLLAAGRVSDPRQHLLEPLDRLG